MYQIKWHIEGKNVGQSEDIDAQDTDTPFLGPWL